MKSVFIKMSHTTALQAVLFMTGVSAAFANPMGGSVAAGTASIDSSAPGVVNINQSSANAVINWNTFNIAEGETTNFNQPGANSATLNRIADSNPSQVMGNLNANGRVILLNKNGIAFGKNAQVNVGSLIATTASMDDSEVMSNSSGQYHFGPSANEDAEVVNKGTITAANKGIVALVAPSAANEGVINANAGKVGIGGTTKAYAVDLYGDNLILFSGDGKGNASNKGTIVNDDGMVQISAVTAADMVDSVVNMDGIVQARSTSGGKSKIVLEGDNVTITGKLDAHGVAGKGGKVTATAGKKLHYDWDASIDTHASGVSSGGAVTLQGEQILMGGKINAGSDIGKAGNVKLYAGKALNISNGGAATVEDAMSHGSDVELGARDFMFINASIDTSAQTGSNKLTLVDLDANNKLTTDLNRTIKVASTQKLKGQNTRVNLNTRESNSVQNAVDITNPLTADVIYVTKGDFHGDVNVNQDNLTLVSWRNDLNEAYNSRLDETNLFGNVNWKGSNGRFAGFTINGTNSTAPVVSVRYSDNTVVANNVIKGLGTGTGVMASYSDGVKLTGNHIQNTTNGVWTNASDRALISRNRFTGNTNGILSSNNYGVKIKNNTLLGTDAAGSGGIRLSNVDGSAVSGNVISDFETAIRLNSSQLSMVDRNIASNVKTGIDADNSDGLFVGFNVLSGKGTTQGDGILLRNTDHATVFGNSVANFKNDIRLVNSTTF